MYAESVFSVPLGIDVEELYKWLTGTLAQLVVMLAGGVQLQTRFPAFFPSQCTSENRNCSSLFWAELPPALAL